MDINTKAKSKLTLTHILLLMICLAAMNLINAYYYCIFIAIGIFCIIPQAKIHIDPLPVSMLLLLAVAWVLFSPTSTVSMFAPIKPFAYVLCYILGSSLIARDADALENKTSYKLFYTTVVAIALGSFIHYLLNWVTNIGASERNTFDFWTGTVVAATGQASLACIPLALAVACIFAPTKKWIKIASIITLALVLVYNLILSGRTLILMTMIVAAVAFSHRFLKLKRGKARILVITLLVIAIIIFVYQNDLFGVRSFIESSPLYERFFGKNNSTDLDEDGRLGKKLFHLAHMGEYLWGGANIRKLRGHSHDIFLDTHDEAGIFAFIAIVIFMLNTLVHLFKCVRTKSLPFEFRQIVLCIYVGIYIEFMIEPILQGMPWMFALFCLIDGYVSRLIRHNKHVKGLSYEGC